MHLIRECTLLLRSLHAIVSFALCQVDVIRLHLLRPLFAQASETVTVLGGEKIRRSTAFHMCRSVCSPAATGSGLCGLGPGALWSDDRARNAGVSEMGSVIVFSETSVLMVLFRFRSLQSGSMSVEACLHV